MKRRTQTLLVGAVPICALAAVITLPTLSVPFAAEGPGPLFNVLGNVDGKTVIDVSGDRVDPESSRGELDMTTVAVRHNLSLPQVMALWMNPENDIVPLETVIPPGVTPDEAEEQNKMMFTESEGNASTAAFTRLGLPTKVIAAYTVPGSAADGVIHEKDEIVSVDGQRVERPEQVRGPVFFHKPGDELQMTLRRDGKEITKTIKLGENPDAPKMAMLGIGMDVEAADGTKVDYKLSGIGGPSAGLMLTLGVIDKLSPGDLTGGHHIAGTGTIDGAGSVGEIGGITHKIAAARDSGAQYFFVPQGNCDEAKTADAGEMKLINVSTLDDALAALKDLDGASTCS